MRHDALADRALIDMVTSNANGAIGSDSAGQYVAAEVDLAMTDNFDNMPSEQEWRIRKPIAAEKGLAPTEGDGWKDICRGCAEQARKLLKEREDALRQTRVEPREDGTEPEFRQYCHFACTAIVRGGWMNFEMIPAASGVLKAWLAVSSSVRFLPTIASSHFLFDARMPSRRSNLA